MADIQVRLGAGTADLFTGDNVPTAKWQVSFDHAALVTAGRSRADANDLYMWHTGVVGAVTMTSISGANTATCKVAFNAVQNIAASATDFAYRIGFGNLGATTATALGSAGPASPADARVDQAIVPALGLPEPGYVIDRSEIQDVDELPYPEWRTPHRALRNQNPRRRYRFVWPVGLPVWDWYAIRAVVQGSRGGVSTVTAPAALSTKMMSESTAIVPVPGSLRLSQHSKLGFSAELEVETVPI